MVLVPKSILVNMIDDSDPKPFRTLRGFLNGEEPAGENYFCFSATLRIHGENLPFDELTHRLAVQPTRTRRKGERPGPRSPEYRDDAWHFQPAVAETAPLDQHLAALWRVVQPHVEYLKSIKRCFRLDVFCGYRSNCDHAGFEVSHTSLELFTALEIPFGVSVIVA